MNDLELLIQDKYEGQEKKVTDEDRARLKTGEPLAYVIGWVPFLDLHIDLSSKPLIPRPETEWWTEKLIEHLKHRFNDKPFRLLDLCAGSGAIGLAVLKHCPNSLVWFGELMPEHCAQIRKNIEWNGIDPDRTDVRESDAFENFRGLGNHMIPFNVIVANPPYIPSSREKSLEGSVTSFEPHEALFAGTDGMDVIRKIAMNADMHLYPDGEVWIEADVDNVLETWHLFRARGAEPVEILTDPYDRQRVVVAYY